MRPHIVGVAGPSCSGKTELARQLAQSLPGTSLASLDSYYRAMDHLPLQARAQMNFDHPDALEWPLLHRHLEAMATGLPFDEPVYSFAEHTRTAETRRIEPGNFVIVEGLFVFYWPELRAVLNTRVYVETDPAVCFQRRLQRDVAERGRTPESVREQYERTVRPSAERFVIPTREFAGLVVSGEEPLANSVAAVRNALSRAKAVGQTIALCGLSCLAT
jgi:uridine kinase